MSSNHDKSSAGHVSKLLASCLPKAFRESCKAKGQKPSGIQTGNMRHCCNCWSSRLLVRGISSLLRQARPNGTCQLSSSKPVVLRSLAPRVALTSQAGNPPAAQRLAHQSPYRQSIDASQVLWLPIHVRLNCRVQIGCSKG